ncbi:MAG: hypothetical protein JWQ79_4122 [Mucilaginibacter sp.]|nr:hypothetical protein [Mucilaginibacter sp.]
MSVNDTSHSGNQPFYGRDGSFVICNGEIYNSEELKEKYLREFEFISSSDCEVILPLYKLKGISCIAELQGEFALIIYDASLRRVVIARDAVGVRPLYISCDTEGALFVGSELKSIPFGNANHFPPGHIACVELSKVVEWSCFNDNKEIAKNKTNISFDESVESLHSAISKSVKQRLKSDVPLGCFLSGGIDSSAVAALAAKFSDRRISTFTLRIDGLVNEDAYYARKVAEYIGSDHHEITTNLDEIFSLIDEVIFISETFNFEMIPNLILLYLVARYVSTHTLVKVILDGTGPDEMLGGYWFFKDAPTPEDFEEETVKQLTEMHRTELLGDRVVSHFGLEMRYPYLDKVVKDIVLQLPVEFKTHVEHGSEKYILRKSMERYLPSEIAWRKKLGMTHGAGVNFENIFDQEIRRRLGTDTAEEAHERILGTETYYKNVFFSKFPNAHNVECNVTASKWRASDPLAIWR